MCNPWLQPDARKPARRCGYTTPLIDVMLVLLIMLIVALPPQRHMIKLDAPRPCPDCFQEEPHSVRIALDFDGSLTWNGAPVSVTELDHRLAAEARRALQAEIQVQPHRLTKYGHLAHVMAVAQREGLTRLGVVGVS